MLIQYIHRESLDEMLVSILSDQNYIDVNITTTTTALNRVNTTPLTMYPTADTSHVKPWLAKSRSIWGKTTVSNSSSISVTLQLIPKQAGQFKKKKSALKLLPAMDTEQSNVISRSYSWPPTSLHTCEKFELMSRKSNVHESASAELASMLQLAMGAAAIRPVLLLRASPSVVHCSLTAAMGVEVVVKNATRTSARKIILSEQRLGSSCWLRWILVEIFLIPLSLARNSLKMDRVKRRDSFESM